MDFLSFTYGLFLLSVLGIYWSVSQTHLRLLTLLIASLTFYASLQIAYVPLLLALLVVNFYLGKTLEEETFLGQKAQDPKVKPEAWSLIHQDWNQQRLKLLFAGIGFNLLILMGFKYTPFLLQNLGQALGLEILQIQSNWLAENLLAPLGISFFIFECIAYLVDIYRGAPAAGKWLDFATYKLFFPKLISGPITRYHPFIAQAKSPLPPTPEKIVEGLWLIAWGALKKGVLANHLDVYVKLCFDNIPRTGSSDLWLATFAYGLQLLLDFSAYVDIVRGSALLLGFNLPQNFDFPYFSTSIAAFWRRWHMSLGDWLRNYLYFPLGGSRRGLWRTCLNLWLVMVLAGIWHGADWGFLVWGMLHGFALGVHRLTDMASKRWTGLKWWWQSLPGIVCAWVLTQMMVFVSWIFFRLPNLKDSGWVVGHLWGQVADSQFTQKVYGETLGFDRLQMTAILGALVGMMAVSYLFNRGLKVELNWPLKLVLVPVCLLAVWLLAPQGGSPYIYFDF